MRTTRFGNGAEKARRLKVRGATSASVHPPRKIRLGCAVRGFRCVVAQRENVYRPTSAIRVPGRIFGTYSRSASGPITCQAVSAGLARRGLFLIQRLQGRHSSSQHNDDLNLNIGHRGYILATVATTVLWYCPGLTMHELHELHTGRAGVARTRATESLPRSTLAVPPPR